MSWRRGDKEDHPSPDPREVEVLVEGSMSHTNLIGSVQYNISNATAGEVLSGVQGVD